jgi:hypothetical protein
MNDLKNFQGVVSTSIIYKKEIMIICFNKADKFLGIESFGFVVTGYDYAGLHPHFKISFLEFSTKSIIKETDTATLPGNILESL